MSIFLKIILSILFKLIFISQILGQTKIRYQFDVGIYDVDLESNIGIQTSKTEYESGMEEFVIKDNQILVFRKYHKGTKQVKFEYLRVGIDSFLYNRTSLDTDSLDISGIYTFSQDKFDVDTTMVLDYETYEVSEVFYLYLKKVKNGFWKNFENGCSGYYIDDIKHGEWNCYDAIQKSHKTQIYSEGLLTNEVEKNLIRNEFDVSLIQKVLMKDRWFLETDNYELTFYKTNSVKRQTVQFMENTLKISKRHGSKKVKWNLNSQERIIIIDNVEYDIIWLKTNFISLVAR